jgi:hypothetical protein
VESSIHAGTITNGMSKAVVTEPRDLTDVTRAIPQRTKDSGWLTYEMRSANPASAVHRAFLRMMGE